MTCDLGGIFLIGCSAGLEVGLSIGVGITAKTLPEGGLGLIQSPVDEAQLSVFFYGMDRFDHIVIAWSNRSTQGVMLHTHQHLQPVAVYLTKMAQLLLIGLYLIGVDGKFIFIPPCRCVAGNTERYKAQLHGPFDHDFGDVFAITVIGVAMDRGAERICHMCSPFKDHSQNFQELFLFWLRAVQHFAAGLLYHKAIRR